MGATVRIVAAALLLAGCSSTVAGQGALAPEALVPAAPTASPAPAPGSSAASGPASGPASSSAPAPRPTGSRAPAAATVPAGFAGTWQGSVAQPGGSITRWTAQLRLPAGQRAGVFAIAGYCRGTATVLAASRTRLVLREVISSDPRNTCAASGLIRLTPSGDGRLRFDWQDSDHPTNTATGLLRRT